MAVTHEPPMLLGDALKTGLVVLKLVNEHTVKETVMHAVPTSGMDVQPPPRVPYLCGKTAVLPHLQL